mgnify:CR=1 FL=1|jgi:hypothetical protein|tara:strand:- start:1480 stop:1737 length:258 start_codon:yes stop_codon:yes gene_type:complete
MIKSFEKAAFEDMSIKVITFVLHLIPMYLTYKIGMGVIDGDLRVLGRLEDLTDEELEYVESHGVVKAFTWFGFRYAFSAKIVVVK